MRHALAAIAFLALLLPIAQACVWLERADMHVISQNGYPIEGATIKMTYQRHNANESDTNDTMKSDANGFASYRMCDEALDGIIYGYNITVTEPYFGGVKFLPQAYAPSRGGVNSLYFVYEFNLYNLTVDVKGRNGLPAPNANITITGGGRTKNLTATTGSAWAVILAGDYTVSTVFPDNTTANQTVTVRNITQSILLVQSPLTSKTLTVKLADDLGQPLENFTVLLDVGGDTPLEALSNASGTARLDGIQVFFARLEVQKDNRTLYSAPLQLANSTSLNITLDINPPNIAGVNASYRNVGDASNDIYEIKVNADITDAGTRPGLGAKVFYEINGGQLLSADMGQSGGAFTGTLTFPNIDAPFDIMYYVNATDAAGNSRVSSRTTMPVEPVPPISLITPTPTPTPGGGNGTGGGILGPVAGMLESVSTYIWALIILVLVILGGTVFVFVAMNAFFYMNSRQLKKP